jgi:hypothetical protein
MVGLIGVFIGLLCLCPLATDAPGIPRTAYWALGCALLLVGMRPYWKARTRRRLLLALGLLGVFAALAFSALQQPKALAIPAIALLPFSLLLAYPPAALRKITEAMSTTMLVLLAGAWVGFLYFQAGGRPTFSFAQYDERISELYLTTLSVTVQDQGFMRPSSIFDEPGTLSFIAVCVACLRIVLGLRAGKTVAIMVLGLVTGSIAHFICMGLMLMHVASVSGIWRRVRPTQLLLGLIVTLPAAWMVYGQLIAPRLVETSSGGIEADTRTPLILRSLLLLDQASPVSGLEQGLCYFDPVTCVSTYGVFLESPLGPYLALGLPASLPYYLFLVTMLVLAVVQRRMALIHLTIFAIFLQRPYVLNLGYGSMAALYLVTVLQMRRQQAPAAAASRRRPRRRTGGPSTNSPHPPPPTMLYIVSTFIRCDDALREMRVQLQALRAHQAVTWLVSSPDSAVQVALADLTWCHVVTRADRSYAEGWNNALAQLPSQPQERADRVAFLGAGDALETLPADLSLFDERSVCCGVTRRTDEKGNDIQWSRPAVKPDRFWLRIGAWTPGCLFPRFVLADFRSPVDVRVGADIALFFHARELGCRFVNVPELRVSMKTGGLSDDPRKGLRDYLRVARQFGTGFPLLQAGHALRWLRARSVFR